MTYNYDKQIRVCSKVSYILKENNDARDLSPFLRMKKKRKKIPFTASHGVEKPAHKFTRDRVCTRKGAGVCGLCTVLHTIERAFS